MQLNNVNLMPDYGALKIVQVSDKKKVDSRFIKNTSNLEKKQLLS